MQNLVVFKTNWSEQCFDKLVLRLTQIIKRGNKMKIPAKMLRAVIPFAATKDVRFYLWGFNVTSKYIQATNGQVAIQLEHGIKRPKKGIYNIKQKIPAKCVTVEFHITKNRCFVDFLDLCDDVIGMSVVDVIDGEFPNIEDNVLCELYKKPIDNVSLPLIQTQYLAILSVAFKSIPFSSVEFEFRGESSGVICTLPKNHYSDELGNPVVIIMPMRK